MSVTKVSERKFVLCAALITLLLVISFIAACRRSTVVREDETPRIAAKTGTALLVIIRATNDRDDSTIDHYLDGKMIGQTDDGSCFFLTDVKPGVHYVMAHAGNWATARIRFEASRIYFLEELIIPKFILTNTDWVPLTAKEAMKAMDGIDYRVYDITDPKEDMPQEEYEEIRDEFEKEVRENPDRYRATLLYNGYAPEL